MEFLSRDVFARQFNKPKKPLFIYCIVRLLTAVIFARLTIIRRLS